MIERVIVTADAHGVFVSIQAACTAGISDNKVSDRQLRGRTPIAEAHDFTGEKCFPLLSSMPRCV